MRVRKAVNASQGGRRIIKARFAGIARGAEDEGFGCAHCGLVMAVTRTEAADRAAAFECPFCGGHSVSAVDLMEEERLQPRHGPQSHEPVLRR